MPSEKFLLLVLAACAVLGAGIFSAAEQPLQHPGVLVSKAQLDFVKTQVAAKVEPFYTQFLHAQASEYGDLNYKVKGPPADGIIACGSYSRPNLGCYADDADASAAYLQALLWYITGNRAYARNAITIMNTYGHNLKGYALSNAPLQAAWGAEKWPRAAEIFRYSHAGWAPANIQAFSEMLTKVELPLIVNGSPANGNWELSMIEGMMGIAVFTDNRDLLNHAAEMWKQRCPRIFTMRNSMVTTLCQRPAEKLAGMGKLLSTRARTEFRRRRAATLATLRMEFQPLWPRPRLLIFRD